MFKYNIERRVVFVFFWRENHVLFFSAKCHAPPNNNRSLQEEQRTYKRRGFSNSVKIWPQVVFVNACLRLKFLLPCKRSISFRVFHTF